MSIEHPIDEQIKNPEATIMGLLGEIMTMGANDYEKSAVDEILARLRRGELTPKQAIAETARIRDAKQDHH